MISSKFENEIWIYFQTNLRPRTRKEYWNVIKSFDKLTGHDPLKLTRKEAMNYYNSLIEKVNSSRLSYNTAVMRLSVMKSVCTFIETYTINHGKRYVNHFESMSLPEQDKILPKDAIPDTKPILENLSEALDANDNKAFLIFSLVIKMGLTNQEICNLNKEYICRNQTGHLCINMPPKNHISRFLIIPDDLGTILDTYILWLKIYRAAHYLQIYEKTVLKCAIQNVFLLHTQISL